MKRRTATTTTEMRNVAFLILLQLVALPARLSFSPTYYCYDFELTSANKDRRPPLLVVLVVAVVHEWWAWLVRANNGLRAHKNSLLWGRRFAKLPAKLDSLSLVSNCFSFLSLFLSFLHFLLAVRFSFFLACCFIFIFSSLTQPKEGLNLLSHIANFLDSNDWDNDDQFQPDNSQIMPAKQPVLPTWTTTVVVVVESS